GDDLVARRPREQAGGQRRHQADDLRALARRGGLVVRPQQARLFQGGQVEGGPRLGVGRQHDQRLRGGAVRQDRVPQPQGFRLLLGDELVARQRGGRRQDVEGEGDVV